MIMGHLTSHLAWPLQKIKVMRTIIDKLMTEMPILKVTDNQRDLTTKLINYELWFCPREKVEIYKGHF